MTLVPVARHRLLSRPGGTLRLQDDGMCQPCEGRVYVNPTILNKRRRQLVRSVSCNKAAAKFQAHNVLEVLLLLKAAVGSAWFSAALKWPHAWLNGWVAFVDQAQERRTSSPHGSMVVYMGPDPKHFYNTFRTFQMELTKMLVCTCTCTLARGNK